MKSLLFISLILFFTATTPADQSSRIDKGKDLAQLRKAEQPHLLTNYCDLYGAVYIESVASFADHKVFVEDVEAFSDMLVYKESALGFANQKGLWYFTDVRGFADFTVYLEQTKGFADFSIYYTDFRSLAGCQR